MALAIYSTATGRLRRIINNSAGENQSNRALEGAHPAFAGETRIRVRDNLGLEGVVAAVLTDSGITPANDRYAVVASNGDVVGVVIADPLTGDRIPDHTLAIHADARIGWRQMRNGTFQRSQIEIDKEIVVWTQRREFVFDDPLKGVDAPYTTAELAARNDAKNAEADATLTSLQTERTARLVTR